MRREAGRRHGALARWILLPHNERRSEISGRSPSRWVRYWN
jgi:hypothetical protein